MAGLKVVEPVQEEETVQPLRSDSSTGRNPAAEAESDGESPDGGSRQRVPTNQRATTRDRRRAARRFRTIRIGLVFGDAVGIVATLVLIRALSSGLDSADIEFVIGVAVAPLIWVGVFHGFSLYNVHHLTGPEEFRRIFSATSVGILLIMLFGFWWEQPTSPEMGIRRLVRWYMRHRRREGPLSLTTLIVGANGEARRLAEVLTPPLGFSAIGFVAASADDSGQELELPVLGKIGDLRDTIKDLGAECVFVASSAVSEEEIPEIYRACRFAGVEIMISANLPVLITSRLTVQPIGKVMALSVRSVGLSGTQAVIKRAFDLASGTVGLVVWVVVVLAYALVLYSLWTNKGWFSPSR